MLQLMILFTAIPLVELWLLFQMADWLGFWETIGLVLGTGFVGASLARWQGWQVMERVQKEMQQGAVPTGAMGDGALILVAGLLLITPGILTDLAGLSLLVPPIRILIKKGFGWWWARHIQVKASTSWDFSSNTSPEHPPHDTIIEARVIRSEVVDDDP